MLRANRNDRQHASTCRICGEDYETITRRNEELTRKKSEIGISFFVGIESLYKILTQESKFQFFPVTNC